MRFRRLMRLLLGLALVSVPAAVQGQETGRIVGRVTAALSGAPISEAQIYLVEEGLGGLSRQNGGFIILQVPPGTYEIRAERIGLAAASQQVTVAAGQVLEVNFQLSSQALGLDEIVVTGTAGAARRREVGNAISELRIADMPTRPTTLTDLLTGAAPGMEVAGLSGTLGNGAQIRLRGNTTVSMSNQPLIYVDGVRMQSKAFPQSRSRVQGSSGSGGYVTANPLNNINPNDVERIEVIKGSAATTLYGTEASAGVIQIFTKRGSTGAPVWSVETRQGLSRAQIMGRGSPFKYHRLGPFLRNGYVGGYSASVRGGGQALQYFVSGNFEDGIGILPSDSITKLSARGNFTFSPTSDLQVQFNTAFARQTTRNTPTGGNEAGITHNAYRGVSNYLNSEDPDVLAQLFDADFRISIDRLTTGLTVTHSALSNLTNRLSVGYDFSQQETRNIRPFGFVLFGPGSISNDNWSNSLLTIDYVGTFGFEMTDDIRSNFSWGGQAIGEEELRLNGYGESFPGAASPTVSSSATRFSYEDRSKIWNAGFFVQNVFDIRDKYFVTLGARVDGNSAFGSGFGLQMYPKTSASYVMSDEDFWQDSWGALKLRAAYGKSGRAPGAFDATRTWNSEGFGPTPALIPGNLGNPDLGPEVTAEFEFGFDGDFIDGRLQTGFTYYSQTTSDALFSVGQVPSGGFISAQRTNVGELKNSGVEVDLAYAVIRGADWGWDLGFILTTNNSEVTDLGGAPPFTVERDVWVIEGQPAPVVRGRFISNAEEAATPVVEQNHIYGPTQPTLNWSPSTSFRFPGGIFLTARGEFKGGHTTLESNFTRGGVGRSAWMPLCWDFYVNPYNGPAVGFTGPAANNNTLDLKGSTPALYRALCTPSLIQESYTARKGDFFRLRTLSLQVPLDFAFQDRVNSSVLTLSLNNAFTWVNSEWRVGDPEMRGNPESFRNGAISSPPPVWSFNASLRVQF